MDDITRDVYRYADFVLNSYLAITTKNRIKCFNNEILLFLKDTFDVIAQRWDVRIIEFKGGGDYVCLLLDYPHRINISSFIMALKGTSSVYTRKQFKDHLAQFPSNSALWERHYCLVSTEPKTTDGKSAQQIVDDYIANKKLKT